MFQFYKDINLSIWNADQLSSFYLIGAMVLGVLSTKKWFSENENQISKCFIQLLNSEDN